MLWRLTDKKVHATDATNASRTSLYNIEKLEWDDEILSIFDVPRSMMPTVMQPRRMGTTHGLPRVTSELTRV